CPTDAADLRQGGGVFRALDVGGGVHALFLFLHDAGSLTIPYHHRQGLSACLDPARRLALCDGGGLVALLLCASRAPVSHRPVGLSPPVLYSAVFGSGIQVHLEELRDSDSLPENHRLHQEQRLTRSRQRHRGDGAHDVGFVDLSTHQVAWPLVARSVDDPAAPVSRHRDGLGDHAFLSARADSYLRYAVDFARSVRHALHSLRHSLHAFRPVTAAPGIGRSGVCFRGIVVDYYAAHHDAFVDPVFFRRMGFYFPALGQRAVHVDQ